jgi:Xaa-Pro aminopeptidase
MDIVHDFFSQEFFINNRKRLREAADGAPVVLTANGVMQRSADTTYKFRQDSSFWYFTGINYPDIVLVLDGGEEFVIVPTRDPILEVFEGEFDPVVIKKISGVRTVLNEIEGWERLEKLAKKSKKIGVLPALDAYLDFYQFYSNPARATVNGRVKSANKRLELVDLRPKIAAMRKIKQAPELQAIRKAVDATVAGMKYVTERLTTYKYEYEVEADLTREFRRRGCGHSFDPIVVCGERGTMMHATENDGPMKKGQLTIIDIGAEAGLYASDIARTVLFGEPTPRQRALHEAVVAAQDYGYTLIKPGLKHRDYENLVQEFIGEKLAELGVIKSSEIKEKNIVRKHFPHMMSHFVGLEAHDVGDYDQEMKAGTVMVMEPGMYIFDEGLGCRVEDVVTITENGYELLSKDLPRQLVVSS